MSTHERLEAPRRDVSTAEITRNINRCIEVCIDSEKDYALAAADIRNTDLKNLFLRRERERAGFVIALQRIVRELGTFPENEGSTLGIAHRGWSAVVRAIRTRHERTILQQCVETEDLAIGAYDSVLDRARFDGRMRAVRGTLERQRALMHDAMRDLQLRIARSDAAH